MFRPSTKAGLKLLMLGLLCAPGVGLTQACSCEEVSEPATDPASRRARPARAHAGLIEGVVILAAGATLPTWPSSPLIAENRAAIPSQCTAPGQADLEPVRLGRERGLDGVLVALADFEREVSHEPESHRIAIDDCRLSQRIVAATVGDTLVLTNQTDYTFFPQLGETVTRAVLFRREREMTLEQAGVRTIDCTFSAPCGRTEVVTLYHPMHTLSGQDGHFRIENVPAADQLTVSAWHPLFGEQRMTVELTSNERRELRFELTPTEMVSPSATPTDPSSEPGPY